MESIGPGFPKDPLSISSGLIITKAGFTTV
jgi:hypothetical protein